MKEIQTLVLHEERRTQPKIILTKMTILLRRTSGTAGAIAKKSHISRSTHTSSCNESTHHQYTSVNVYECVDARTQKIHVCRGRAALRRKRNKQVQRERERRETYCAGTASPAENQQAGSGETFCSHTGPSVRTSQCHLFNASEIIHIHTHRERERERETHPWSVSISLSLKTHTHTHTYIYIYILCTYSFPMKFLHTTRS